MKLIPALISEEQKGLNRIALFLTMEKVAHETQTVEDSGIYALTISGDLSPHALRNVFDISDQSGLNVSFRKSVITIIK